eukprot:TRINITY_DN1836_c0_g1_i1.p1 TRINITY_DN1836_c0_g1~~TRINITY_DN1836_c0_g1_i1.p1  ORF type:complete len:331 (+),score=51.19 TRINITY_DN1836_c0_g1_i1:69-1061(+)
MSVLNSAQYISTHAKNVTIDEEGVHKTAATLLKEHNKGKFSLTGWSQNELHPKIKNDNTVNWIFIVDTLNFSFWAEEENLYTVTFRGKRYTGYWSLCAAIRRAEDEGIPITDPSYLKSITREQVEHIFRSDTSTNISLLNLRHKGLQEAGTILIEKFQGSFVNCIKMANQSAVSLLDLIVNNFPSFRDETTYNGQTVQFYKRAQILVADIWACFEGESYGQFYDINEITMFADYRVPQILVELGVLKYSSYFLEKLRKNELLPPGHELECEVRGCSIWAVELIKREMLKLNKGSDPKNPINAITIDFYLWDLAQLTASTVPIHRTRTVFY